MSNGLLPYVAKRLAEARAGRRMTNPRRNIRENVDGTGRVIGFIEYTPASFWTAYSYRAGMGHGPFFDVRSAVAYVRAHCDPVPGYSR